LEALGEGEITQRRLIQQAKLEIEVEEEMQQRRLQERSQPIDKLDKEIEEIRRLMLKSTKETVNNRWRLTRGDCSGKINGHCNINLETRRRACSSNRQQQQQERQRSRWTTPE
jgi:hypothetical protein